MQEYGLQQGETYEKGKEWVVCLYQKHRVKENGFRSLCSYVDL